jgi:hypothetical protein
VGSTGQKRAAKRKVQGNSNFIYIFEYNMVIYMLCFSGNGDLAKVCKFTEKLALTKLLQGFFGNNWQSHQIKRQLVELDSTE